MTEEENTTSGTVICAPKNLASGLNTAEGFMSACVAIGEVAIEFRPTESYDGSFGFDWLRVGDTNLPGDVDYKSIMGWHLEGNPNKDFIANSSKFEALKQQYTPIEKHPINENEDYYTPSVTLRNNETAHLDMLVTVNEIPSEIFFEYNESYFEINDEIDIESLSVGQVKTKMKDHLSIKCINEFEEIQYVKVLGNEKLIGQLQFLPNKNTKKSIKVCFIEITSSSSNTETIPASSVNFVKKFLNHAFISVSDVKLTLDISDSLLDIYSDRRKQGLDYSRVIDIDQGFSRYLRKKLSEKYGLNTYRDYYKIYYIDEEIINNIPENQIPIYGKTYELRNFPPINPTLEDNDPKPIAVIFRTGLRDITAAHELFHALDVIHSFEENDLFSYKVLTTHNLMDYNNSSSKINTWKWQWQQINSNL